jgi:hypothetical protein
MAGITRKPPRDKTIDPGEFMNCSRKIFFVDTSCDRSGSALPAAAEDGGSDPLQPPQPEIPKPRNGAAGSPCLDLKKSARSRDISVPVTKPHLL